MKKVLSVLGFVALCACTTHLTQTDPILTNAFRKSDSGSLQYTKEAKECYNDSIFGAEIDFSITSIAKKITLLRLFQ